MARYFNFEQASALLPEVERLLRAAVEARARYAETETALVALQERIQMMGGVSVDRESIGRLRESRGRAAESLQAALEDMSELGVQVKDVDTGLVDFPTLYRGQEALLCWKLGEDCIAYWHGVNDGFQGRKRIDSTFLHEHRGSGAH
ncbi:MAG: DUF2203 domain-containing protein [Bryobacteraceae bacterium]